MTQRDQMQALRRERRDVEREIEALIDSAAEFSRPFRILTSVPSVGTIVGATLPAEMPELGSRGRRPIAALGGLAPFPCDSGERRGYRAIRGGLADVRKALFNAARVAISTTPSSRRATNGCAPRANPARSPSSPPCTS
jgi:transposase